MSRTDWDSWRSPAGNQGKQYRTERAELNGSAESEESLIVNNFSKTWYLQNHPIKVQVSWSVIYSINILVWVSIYINLRTVLVLISMQISNIEGKIKQTRKGRKLSEIPETQNHPKHEMTWTRGCEIAQIQTWTQIRHRVLQSAENWQWMGMHGRNWMNNNSRQGLVDNEK